LAICEKTVKNLIETGDGEKVRAAVEEYGAAREGIVLYRTKQAHVLAPARKRDAGAAQLRYPQFENFAVSDKGRVDGGAGLDPGVRSPFRHPVERNLRPRVEVSKLVTEVVGNALQPRPPSMPQAEGGEHLIADIGQG
jgi:hypothetical protein